MPPTHAKAEPIAVVGIGCRFPGGASTPSKLWDLVSKPRDVLVTIPSSRFNPEGFYHEDGEYGGHSNVRHSYLLTEDHTAWDAGFFNVAAGEAVAIDPQQRLLMECVYEALEAGGHSIQALRGSDTAVYVGLVGEEYSDIHYRELNTLPRYFPTGTSRAVMSNRISYFFDWRGASMTIDTACSSSLVAVHQAVQVLRSGASKVAVAAGAQLILGPEPYIFESTFHMLSPSGRCRMWSNDADGYGRGDGIAAVVLKTLSQAIADGDRIECVIRETGVNQDGGATSGITVPNPDSQIALIEDTYRRAGLDLALESDRPQFFECHGTGTPTGDPLEAKAIHAALGRHIGSTNGPDARPLYVGSIKTVIGHTEATAGIAGLIKASLAVQEGLVPPNLLFEELNPAIAPLHAGLKVPVGEAIVWPATQNQPRRVSVNSFGFGGTNAHAIVESYQQPSNALTNGNGVTGHGDESTPLTFSFSAATEASLKRMLKDFGDFLSAQKLPQNLRPQDLAFTLNARRSVFPCRAAFAARGLEDLGKRIRDAVADKEWQPTAVANDTKEDGPIRLLGVFAGQGAQWAGMARNAIKDLPFVQKRLEELEVYLASLPDEADRPTWSLREELSKVQGSRLHLAQFAQPLCTALQIIQVDLLAAAKVHFSAVVGHSSGEIAAAYAAGLLSARDAMVVAYYRGVHSSQVAGSGASKTTKGAMMAAGMNMTDAQDLAASKRFHGRIAVAAHNSPTSITLSGDEDAILEAEKTLKARGKFARLLRVDQAYHSHHMKPKLQAYIAALRRAGVGASPIQSKSGDGRPNPVWYSSVSCPGTGQQVMRAVDTEYWAVNMGQTVLFAGAVENAVRAETAAGLPFTMAVGVGPHGALRGPLDDILAAIPSLKENGSSGGTPPPLPYVDVLTRYQDDSLCVLQCIGQIWAHHAGGVDMGRFQKMVYQLESRGRRLVPPRNLPAYPWDHSRTFWHESRRSRAFRTRTKSAHPLLGTLSPDSTPTDLRWHNQLRVTDLPWLRGHRLQGQIIYPAAAYMVGAIDAALHVAETRQRRVKKIELKDMWIGKAIVFEDETSSGGVEVLTTLNVNEDAKIDIGGNTIVNAQFRFRSSVLGSTTTDAPLNSSGSLLITLFDEAEGQEDQSLLSPQQKPPALLVDVGEDGFYTALKQLGYQYTDCFRALTSAKRKLGYTEAALTLPVPDEIHRSEREFLLHPGPLDALFQAVLLAYAWPGDGRLWSMHVPVKVDRIQIDVEQVRRANRNCKSYKIDANITQDPSVSGRPQDGLGGDVGLFTPNGDCGLVLAEGVRLAPLATASPHDDLQMFLETVEGAAFPSCPLAMASADDKTVARATDAETSLGWLLERIAHFYLARLAREITPEDEARAEWHHQKLMVFARHAAREVAAGRRPYAKPEWANDTHELMCKLMDERMDTIDVQLMRSVGENLPAAVRGETMILQHMMQDGMLTRSYEETLGVAPYSGFLANVIEQIAFVHPNALILEIGGGTGGATKRILNRIPDAFGHYTFTDVSTGFFEAAESVFSDFVESGRMSFRPLDIERDPVEQGFQEHLHSYDILLASFVLHATADLENTLRNARRLLKPGGYLVLLEMTSNDTMRLSMTMGGLEGWWLGAETGRPWSPCVSTLEWHRLLKSAGFTGVEESTPELDPLAWPFGVLVSRAVDERVQLLLEPSAHAPTSLSTIPELLIIAGSSLPSVRLAEKVHAVLQPFSPAPVTLVSGGLGGFLHEQSRRRKNAHQENGSLTVLYLADLDERPFLECIEPDAFHGLKELFSLSPRHVLWVTHGARQGKRPYAVASVGLGRALMMEYSHVMMQFLDFAQAEPNARALADDLLRMRILSAIEQQEGNPGVLWSHEPEVAIDQQGCRWVSRILPHGHFNEAYNSVRRAIVGPVDLAKDEVEVYDELDEEEGVSRSRLMLRTARLRSADKVPAAQIQPLYSLPLAVQPGGRTWNISVGFTAKSKDAAVVLSERLGSSITPLSEHSLLPWDWAPVSAADATLSLLGSIANHTLASLVTKEAERSCRSTGYSSQNANRSQKTTLLLLEPDVTLAREVSKRVTPAAPWSVVNVTSCSGKWASAPDAFILIDPNASKPAIRKSFGLMASPPRSVCTMVIGSTPASNGQRGHVLAGFLRASLPELARARTRLVAELMEDAHSQPTKLDQDRDSASPPSPLVVLFNDAIASAHLSAETKSTRQDDQDQLGKHGINLISPQEYVDRQGDNPASLESPAIIDWSATSHAPLMATARPLDGMLPLLRGDRTYLLLGLGGKGGLGSSLAEYLVRQGARYIALTSRRPAIDEHLVETYAKQGVRIQGFANDITHRPSLEKLVNDLRDSPDWPPIAGVANGAMVLADSSLENMTYDQMVKVLQPKVDGSILVDRIFSSTPLEFFILFSSLSCVLGNRGQANYDAANTFLVGLAAQRRARGLAASVCDIGAIMGTGYMAREVKEQTLKQMVGAGFDKMSERDFYLAFAHSMLAGCSTPSSPRAQSYEVTTGLRVPPPDDEFQPGWVTNPRFSHMVARSRAAAGRQAQASSPSHQVESTRDMLKRARTLGDVSRIVSAAILKKVAHMLQLGEEVAGNHDALLRRGTSSLGVDSLVAVEIRTWMLREFEVDMPVFRILADTSLGCIVDFTLSALPESLTPCLDKTSHDDAIPACAFAEAKVVKDHAPKPKQQSSASAPEKSNQDPQPPRDSKADLSLQSSGDESRSASSTPPTSGASPEAASKPPSLDKEADHTTKIDLGPRSSSPGPQIQIQKTAPMSYGQKRFWVMSKLCPVPTACNVVNDIEIRAELDKAALSQAVRSLAARHEALRTAFVSTGRAAASASDGDFPQQVVLKESPLRLEMREARSSAEVQELFRELHGKTFNLDTGDLMTIMLVSVSASLHHLLIGYHHINMDSFSMSILMDELLRLYDGQKLPAPATQQADLAIYERKQLQSRHWTKQMAFWRNLFADKTSSSIHEPLPILPLSPGTSTRTRPDRIAYRTHSHRARVPAATARHIRSLCRGAGVTAFHLYATVLHVLIARLADVEHVVVGMADGNRSSLDLAGATEAVGNLLNMVPLLLDTPAPHKSIHSALAETQTVVLQAMSNAALPFELIMEQANAPRSTSHSPLFQVFIDYKKVTEKIPFPNGEGEVEGKRYLLSKTPYDLMLDIIDTPDGDALVELNAQDGLYTSEETEKLLGLYLTLLVSCSQADGQMAVGEAQMFDAKEIGNALRLGQGEILQLDHGSILPRLDAASEDRQDAIALIDTNGACLSRSDMTSKSITVSRILRSRGVGPGDRVGLFQEPTVDWVLSMLGIWRAGASYVPLDLSQGLARLARIAEASQLTVVVVHDATLPLVEKLGVEAAANFVNVSALGASDTRPSVTADTGAWAKIKGSDEAMVLYTSGTTGEPKGISIPHRLVVNGIEGMLRRWPELARTPQTLLQQTSLSFDLSWWTVLLGLSTREGKVVVAARDIRGDPRALTGLIIEHGITFTVATPSETIAWLQSDDSASLASCSWRWHLAGGEPFPLTLLRQLHLLGNPSLRVINAYGPAECWMPLAHEVPYQQATSVEQAEELWPVSLGTVMPNYTVRVVDAGGRVLPPGMPGQLVIGGAGIALGYVNQPELTAQRFPPDIYPVPVHLARGWDRVHLSGDSGYLDAENGVFVSLGRTKGDTQVKLRGLRVDLRDVEASIMAKAQGCISEVVVGVRELDRPSPCSDCLADESATKVLTAHAVFTPSAKAKYHTEMEKAQFLRSVSMGLPLPDYMRPAVIVPVDTFPLTPNGKLDRGTVASWPVDLSSTLQDLQPAVNGDTSWLHFDSSDSTAERDSSREKMSRIWRKALGSALTNSDQSKPLDPRTDFFQAGGNSILLTRVQNMLRTEHGVDVPLRELFHSSTLEQMSWFLGKQARGVSPSGIDWEDETRPPPELELALQVTKLSPIDDELQGDRAGLVVALTGAAGFLGRHIIQRLIEDPDVVEIHCVAIRKNPERLARYEAAAKASSTKLVIHPGDLSQPDLGINDAAELESLFSRADVIIHNGADTSFLKSYDTLRPSNLDSLKALVRFTLVHRTIAPPRQSPRRRPARVHFVSTAGVATFAARDLGEESLGRPPPAHVKEGYLLTKWAGELFLERTAAASRSLLCATVHRTASLTGPGAPELDVVSSVVRYSQVLGAVPTLEGYDGKIQFVPVEEVAGGIVASATDPAGAAIEYRNHCGEVDDAVHLRRLGKYCQKTLGRPGSLPVLEDREWIAKAEAAGFPTLLGTYLRADTLGGKRKTFNILLRSRNSRAGA